MSIWEVGSLVEFNACTLPIQKIGRPVAREAEWLASPSLESFPAGDRTVCRCLHLGCFQAILYGVERAGCRASSGTKREFDLANAIAEKHKLEELEQKSDKAKKELVEGCHAWMQSQKSLDHQVSFERAEVALQHLLEAEKYGFPKDTTGSETLFWDGA